MGFRLESAGLTDPGVQRTHNEDALLVDPDHGLYAICDGMGGHASGAVASQLSIDAIAEAFRTGARVGSEDPLVTAILTANQAVHARSVRDPACRGMGTTVVAVRQEASTLHLCHVGDSRAYLLREGALTQLTRDHSLVNLYADNPDLAGKLGPAHSNIIVRAVGLREYVEVDHQALLLQPGDLYLLCCDGLTDMVQDWQLRELLGARLELRALAESLVAAANEAGGADNISVILLRALAAS
jgi:protein phosphatase